MKVRPDNIHKKLCKVGAGTEVTLVEGPFRDPITFSGKRGSQQRPIFIRGEDTWIGSDMGFDRYNPTANRLAAAHQKGGSFPGVYFIADDAALMLKDCQWVVIEDLVFRNCWPTAIYLDNCQHVTIRNVSFRGGTIAIGATGANTRHLLIEGCDWVQDLASHGEQDVKSIRERGHLRADLSPKDCRLWSKIPWKAVHGAPPDDPLVDVENDARAYDGDFFRAWTIAGYVIIRNNIVTDAFNGVHFFNQASTSTKEAFSRNVLIENNWFVRVRDNAIEAEDFAWNWTARHNRLVDCYMPFSLQMRRSGYFYIYGNLCWNVNVPGPGSTLDTHANGVMFKLPVEHQADGPHYVFNNTSLLRWPIVKKNRMANFQHRNNLVGYATGAEGYVEAKSSPLGPGGREAARSGVALKDLPVAEASSFTRQWKTLDITFDGDAIGHPDFPDKLRQAGYPVGPNARPGAVVFVDNGIGLPEGLKCPAAPAAMPMSITWPDGSAEPCQPAVVGAWQGSVAARISDPAFVAAWPGAVENAQSV